MSSSPRTSSTIHFTPDQAGQYLNLSPRTLEKMRSDGGGPKFRKLGRRIRYTQVDLEAWANSRSYNSTSDAEYFARHRRGV